MAPPCFASSQRCRSFGQKVRTSTTTRATTPTTITAVNPGCRRSVPSSTEKEPGTVVTQDRDMRLTKDKFLQIPWGIGIRKGDTTMRTWVNAALRRLQARDFFFRIA